MKTMKEAAGDFLSQKLIAVVGVSKDTKRTANYIYRKLRAEGYKVAAVNPSTSMAEGDPCYPSLRTLPEKPGAVMIVTRPAITEQVVRECAELGIRHIWMHEGMDIKATSVSQEAINFCHDHSIGVIPGGCPMMYCQHADWGHRIMKWLKGVGGSLPKQV